MTDAVPPDHEAASGSADYLREHEGLLVAVAPIVLAIIKVARVSDLSTETAGAILESQGPLQILLGTLLGIAPILLFYGGLFGGFLLAERVSTGREALYPAVALTVTLVLVTVQIWVAATLLFVGTVLVGSEVRHARAAKTRVFASVQWPRHLTSLGVVLLITVIITAEPWLPTERISVAGRPDPVVGYVLASDSDWTSILTDDDRRVLRTATRRVRSRTICEDPAEARSVLDFVRGKPGSPYPKC